MRTVFLFILLNACAFCALSQNHYSCNDGIVKFSSDALLELINANSSELNGIIDADKKTFAFAVKINSFQGFNAELQQDHFNENYMESAKYPHATFLGKTIEDINFSTEEPQPVRAKGILNVHGTERERIIKATIRVIDNAILVDSKFVILLSDHNIKVPKVVHEKIASEIIVQINARLNKKPVK